MLVQKMLGNSWKIQKKILIYGWDEENTLLLFHITNFKSLN